MRYCPKRMYLSVFMPLPLALSVNFSFPLDDEINHCHK